MPAGPSGIGATAKSSAGMRSAIAIRASGILVEHRAGAGIEAGDDLVEAPVHAVLGRVAVLVEVDEELQSLDRVRAVEGAVALLVEVIVVAHHVGHHHDVAVGAARAAAQAIAGLAAPAPRSSPTPSMKSSMVSADRRGRPAEQLLVPEHRAQIEAVRDHVHGVVDDAAELDRPLVQLARVRPALPCTGRGRPADRCWRRAPASDRASRRRPGSGRPAPWSRASRTPGPRAAR